MSSRFTVNKRQNGISYLQCICIWTGMYICSIVVTSIDGDLNLVPGAEVRPWVRDCDWWSNISRSCPIQQNALQYLFSFLEFRPTDFSFFLLSLLIWLGRDQVGLRLTSDQIRSQERHHERQKSSTLSKVQKFGKWMPKSVWTLHLLYIVNLYGLYTPSVIFILLFKRWYWIFVSPSSVHWLSQSLRQWCWCSVNTKMWMHFRTGLGFRTSGVKVH